MLQRRFSENGDFTLGALFGIILSPVATYIWRTLWDYTILRWFTVSVAWSAFWQNITLAIIAVAILFTYYWVSVKPRREAEKSKETETLVNAVENNNQRIEALIDRIDKLVEKVENNRD